MVAREHLSDEDSIVWEEDIDSFDYVRQTLVPHSRRTGAVRAPAGRRVGYAVLRADSEGPFFRRVFWLKEHDRSEDPGDTYSTEAPAEAVDPRTVSPGEPGDLTERAWGGPLPY